MNLADACFHTVHDYPGGAESLGPRLGKRGTSLSNEVKIRTPDEEAKMRAGNATVPKLGIKTAQRIMKMTGDLRIINAQASDLECMVVRLPALDDACSPAAADVAAVAKRFSDLMCGVVTALDDRRITDNELAQIERDVGMLVATTQRMLKNLGGMNAELHAAAPGAAP